MNAKRIQKFMQNQRVLESDDDEFDDQGQLEELKLGAAAQPSQVQHDETKRTLNNWKKLDVRSGANQNKQAQQEKRMKAAERKRK